MSETIMKEEFLLLDRKQRKERLIKYCNDYLFGKGIEPNEADKVVFDIMAEMNLNVIDSIEKYLHTHASGDEIK